MSAIIVAGIGTDVGKTVVSAILVQALGCDYWKPIQTGGADTDVITNLVSRTDLTIHPACYTLEASVSPHQAARMADCKIDATKIQPPITNRPLLIEMAGGVLVPFNEERLLLDLMTSWTARWIIVSKNYLGSINHTLLTIEALQRRQIAPWGIIFNGVENPDSERFILNYTGLPCLGRLAPEPNINPETIRRYATLWQDNLQQHTSMTS